MKIKFYNRDFTGKAVQPGLDFTVERYGWDIDGGPAEAEIRASGGRDAVFELANHMREPVEILNDRGDAVWWGFLQKLEIKWGNIQFGVDLDTMYNQVAVAYTNGPARFTTQWSGDDDSIAAYGYKQMLLSHSDCTEADALSERDTKLARSKTPIPTMRHAKEEKKTWTLPPSGEEEEGEATITLAGWWSTLEWIYYENLTGAEGYEVTGEGGREIGEDDRPILAMSFQLGSASGWTATSLWLRMWRQGGSTPGDNFNVSIRANNAGVPGTVLASASIVGSTVPTSATWTEFVLNTGVALVPGTTYWIYMARSGSINENAYYMVDTNLANGYPRGAMIYYNTNVNAWVSAAHKGDLLFRLTGSSSTTSQIQTLIATCGQFLAGTIIEDESGVDTIAYRNGDSTGMYELEKLLTIGTINDKRLLGEMTRSRHLRIYEEEAKPATAKGAFGLGADGTLYYPGTRNPVDGELCPVGIWCTPIDVIPATVDLSLVGEVDLFLVEAAEYDSGYRITRTRDQGDPYQVGGIEQG